MPLLDMLIYFIITIADNFDCQRDKDTYRIKKMMKKKKIKIYLCIFMNQMSNTGFKVTNSSNKFTKTMRHMNSEWGRVARWVSALRQKGHN